MQLESCESRNSEMFSEARESLNDRNLPNSESQSLENRDWSRRLLKKKFSERNLEVLFSKYGLRLHRGYFSIFLLIQTSLTLAHIGFLIFYAIDNSTYTTVLDILAYASVEVLLWLLTAIIFKRELVKRHNWLPHLASTLAILCMILVDTVLPVYHTASFDTGSVLRPAYTAHALIACHIFLPQDNNITPVILGITTSALHFAHLYLVTYRNSDDISKQILADAIFFVCINILGIYFRYINEIFIRRTFLDKRACVESTLKLNYEKEREEQLMLSILPRHLASRVRENLRKKLTSNRSGKQMPDNPYTELYVERHNDVSVLYADVVNYTKMTSSLPANRLVEILNELFGRFDEASEKHKVLRIKFLGDCYYCVSGVPQPNPDHAKSCVDLALEMIDIIKDVRDANNLNINMRIGIHSGSILCGILGKCKWQYDIWSKDVIIANHMEQSGRSGMVHVTKQTLDKLGPNYRVEPGFGQLRDEFLAKCNIETFFVSHENKVRRSRLTPWNLFCWDCEGRKTSGISINFLRRNSRCSISPTIRANRENLECFENECYSPGFSVVVKSRTLISVKSFSLLMSTSYNEMAENRSVRQTTVIPPAGIQASLIWRIPVTQPDKQKKRKPFDRNNNTSKVQKYGIDVMYNLKRVISGGGHLLLSRRRGDYTDSDAIMYKQQLKMADAHMEKAVEKLPIGKFNQWFRKDKVGFFSLNFDGKTEWEKPFLQQPDPLFKYYITSALFVFCCIACIEYLAFFRWSSASFIVYCISGFVLVMLLPLTWIHFVWSEVHSKEDSDGIPQPKNSILQKLYGMSLKVIYSALIRTVLYVAVCLTFAGCLVTKLLQEAMQSEDHNNVDGSANDFKLLFGSKSDGFLGPWQMTEGCILAVIMSFLFFRIHFQLKLIIASFISAVYIYFIYNYKSVFDNSETWNPEMPPITAHILSILFIVLELHLVDRQTEFMSRLDYCWKQQLVEEKDEVASTRSINKMLLQNILPIHVAEIYLDANRSSNELYHEDYECVSVMFASLTNYSLYDEADTDVEAMERLRLHILNLIICNFDDALLTKEFGRIEKIKVAGWTYMAACGLVPGSRNSKGFQGKRDNKVVLIIARFAAEMMRLLKNINEKYTTNFGLRVGISHGPVTAGVVGSHKPYYDIWGNTVNVASRMDSTGETGKIQIPEESAEILQSEGVECKWRGNIFVKGKGHMHTFYVQLTEDFFLKED